MDRRIQLRMNQAGTSIASQPERAGVSVANPATSAVGVPSGSGTSSVINETCNDGYNDVFQGDANSLSEHDNDCSAAIQVKMEPMDEAAADSDHNMPEPPSYTELTGGSAGGSENAGENTNGVDESGSGDNMLRRSQCFSESENEVTTAEEHVVVPRSRKPKCVKSSGTKETYFCGKCDRTFKQKANLLSHQRIHSNVKPFKCEFCDLTFRHQAGVKRHCQYIHSNARPYPCDYENCDKSFVEQAQLIKHKRSHSGERPYTCSVCGLGFTQSGNLKRHQLTHSGERPFTCKTCEQRFVTKAHLKKHIATVHAARPFKCDVCDCSFKEELSLEKHRQRHPPDTEELMS